MSTFGSLDEILAPGGLQAVFQPILELRQDQTCVHALEALVRGPRSSPLEGAAQLFDYVREKRAHAHVDRACILEVFRSARQLPEQYRLGLNVHAETLADDWEFGVFLGDAAEVHGIALERLILEIGSEPKGGPRGFFDNLRALRDIGVRLALDDVGGRLAFLGDALQCRPHYLKVARRLVKGAHADVVQSALLESLAALARGIGAQPVATGIEDARDLGLVRELGYRLAQGLLLSPPLPEAQLREGLRVEASPCEEALAEPDPCGSGAR
jgi:EAL domain-containing protein (putative c-di-GMP-specific phosphodiesterase class I)